MIAKDIYLDISGYRILKKILSKVKHLLHNYRTHYINEIKSSTGLLLSSWTMFIKEHLLVNAFLVGMGQAAHSFGLQIILLIKFRMITIFILLFTLSFTFHFIGLIHKLIFLHGHSFSVQYFYLFLCTQRLPSYFTISMILSRDGTWPELWFFFI